MPLEAIIGIWENPKRHGNLREFGVICLFKKVRIFFSRRFSTPVFKKEGDKCLTLSDGININKA